MANTGAPGHFDPGFEGFPRVDDGFDNNYDYPMGALIGMVTQVNAQYNYNKDGSVLPQGAGIKRKFVGKEYETYVQDTWRAMRGLTVTAGLRMSFLPPVHEANGFQTSSNISLSDWFNTRGNLAQQGKSQALAPKLSYQLATAPGGKPLYPQQNDFSPRLGLAYSPQSTHGLWSWLFGGPGKTSFRAGAGMYYDLFGQGIARLYDSTALGFSTLLQNPATVAITSAPRYTGFYDLPVDSALTNGIDVFTAVLGDDGYQTITATDTQVSSITGTSNPIYVIPESGGSPTPTPTPMTPTPTPTPAQPLNLSTRMLVQTGDNVGIGGFIISGSSQKHVILRGIGPSLAGQGVVNPLPDPVLELHGPSGFVTITNDNWTDTTPPLRCGKKYGLSPTNDLESCIEETLDPAPYTAILRDKNSDVGVGLVEIYDVGAGTPSKLANISTRGFVETGDNVMIGGLIVGPVSGGNVTVVVRAIGPTLGNFGIPGALQDPTLDLVNADGIVVRSNNNWRDSQEAEIIATGLQPGDDRESALVQTVAPGNYTAIVRGSGGTTGVALVEGYQLP
jgi:hypothetical protein